MEPLDVTEPAVTEFVHRLYSELTDLFTDEWIHIGGDEGAYGKLSDSVLMLTRKN